jgi:PEP-CTERM motif
MKDLKNLPILSLTMMGLLLAGTTAKADPLSIILGSPFQTVSPGGTVAFDATVTNNTEAVIFLNGDSATLDAPLDPSDLSDADYANFPLSLDPGESFSDPLFTVTVPPGTVAGIYAGSFEITGGGSDSELSNLGSVAFDIDVTGTVVPEPSSLMLLISGMAGLAGTLRRRLS